MTDTVDDWLAAAIQRLTSAGVPNPEVDAQLLIAETLGVSRGRVQALALAGASLTETHVAELDAKLVRRERREPLQHITGTAYFRHLALHVGPGVFVPRPETEEVTQVAIDVLNTLHAERPDGEGLVAVDLCTGSGAIALSVGTEVAGVQVWAVEKSPEAFEWAKKNKSTLGAENVHIELGDVSVAFEQLNGLVDVVVSNPPYIPDDAVPRDPEVRDFDPELALYGGADGLDVVREVSRSAQRLLHSGGWVVIEHGELQGEAIRTLLAHDGFFGAKTLPDFTGRDRVTLAQR